MTKCKQCNADYKPLRADSKYCSPQCRKLAFRSRQISVPNDSKISVPRISVPYNPDIHERPLTPNEKSGITEYGKCHACNKDVSHLRCLCLECLNEGITHKSLSIDIKHC